MPEPVVFSKMGERSDGLLPRGCLWQGRRKSERHAQKEEDVGLETTATLRLAEETLRPGGPEPKLPQLNNCGNSERGGVNRLARRLVQYFEEYPHVQLEEGKTCQPRLILGTDTYPGQTETCWKNSPRQPGWASPSPPETLGRWPLWRQITGGIAAKIIRAQSEVRFWHFIAQQTPSH